MKKYQSLTISFFYVLLLGFQFWGLSACRKTSTFTDKPVEGKIIFSYNGTKYVLPYNEVTKDWNIESGYGIFINRLDIFEGSK